MLKNQEKEREAIEEAHKIVAKRCAEAGVEYGEEQRKWMYWCFMGAIRIRGIDELMRYAREVKISRGKKTVWTGYASVEEMEELI